MILFALACGTVSDALFVADAEFLAAFPDPARQALAGPTFDEGAAGGLGDRAELLNVTLAEGAWTNAALAPTFAAVVAVSSAPPTERTESTRRWGPAVDGCGLELRALMSRSAGVYPYSVSGHDGASTDAVVLYGTHFAGTSVTAGDGSFVWDAGRYADWCGLDSAGLVTVDYDNRDGIEISVTLDGYTDGLRAPASTSYTFSAGADGGEFTFEAPVDLAADAVEGAVPLDVRTRWSADGAGRADAHVEGGAETWSQCWDAAGLLTWQSGVFAALGDAESCAFGSE